MTRMDITTRELHGLINPVLPHVSTNVELPQLNTVHLEARRNVLYAVATDRSSLAAERLVIDDYIEDLDVNLDRSDLAAALKLFTYSKDIDPKLTITVDRMPIPVGRETVTGQGLRIDAEDGTCLVLHDRRPPDANPFASWRKMLGAAVHRAIAPAAPALILTPSMFARWAKAARKGERLQMFVGPDSSDLILITVEDHFAGAWQPSSHVDEAEAATLSSNPWRHELSSGKVPA